MVSQKELDTFHNIFIHRFIFAQDVVIDDDQKLPHL